VAFTTRHQWHQSKSIISRLQSTDDDLEGSNSITKPKNKHKKKALKTISARYIDDNGLVITTNDDGRVIAVPAEAKVDQKEKAKAEKQESKAEPGLKSQPNKKKKGRAKEELEISKAETTTAQKNPSKIKKRVAKFLKEEIPKPVVVGGFNVVLTHCTADFDTLASAVGLAKLWSNDHPGQKKEKKESTEFQSLQNLPTFVVLPRGAHPAVQKFLGLHKHLFPIRSLRSLPADLSALNRLGLVDAQTRDRVGPAEHLISYAKRVTIVDHHIEGDSDIPEATDYVIDKVGSVSAMIAEQLKNAGFELSEAEATLLALGIHADTGSLCYDSTTVRDAEALAWVMSQGASQAAIAEHAHSALSQEQQGVLTNALINTNSTVVHGVTVSTVLLSADGFINGLAAVTQDAMELSSSDVYILTVVYEAKSGRRGKGTKKGDQQAQVHLSSKLMAGKEENNVNDPVIFAEAWKGGERAVKLKRLRAAFDKKDADRSGYLDSDEIAAALAQAGVIASEEALKSLVRSMDTNGDGKIDFDEFVAYSDLAVEMQKEEEKRTGKKATTMIVIGRVKAGVNMKDVNLNHLFQQYGGGGHAKAASCTIKIDDEADAGETLQNLVDELIETSLSDQQTVGDFMTSPVLSAKPTMTEKQVEDLFIRYDVRALPVVDNNNNVIGLVTYKEVAAAKQRLWNKEQKRIRQEAAAAEKGGKGGKKERTKNGNRNESDDKKNDRKLGSALKGWMKQHVQTVEAGLTMAEVEAVLLENDVGSIPVVVDGTNQLVGMVTRTDLLRQHRYYPSLHYHNPGFSDSIAARKPIIELRKKLKKFDLEE